MAKLKFLKKTIPFHSFHEKLLILIDYSFIFHMIDFQVGAFCCFGSDHDSTASAAAATVSFHTSPAICVVMKGSGWVK